MCVLTIEKHSRKATYLTEELAPRYESAFSDEVASSGDLPDIAGLLLVSVDLNCLFHFVVDILGESTLRM